MEQGGAQLSQRVHSGKEIAFQDITVPNDHAPGLDPAWDVNGIRFLKKLIPDDVVDAYVKERWSILHGTDRYRSGWPNPTPYMDVPTMMDVALYRPLTEVIRTLLFGEEPGLHLCLTGFQSTERAWHQDRYLNPEGVGERYIAAWIALDDVHPDAGPFEFVAGSHLWPVIERQRVWDAMAARGQAFDSRTWPSDTQGWVSEACQAEIDRREAVIRPLIARKGDVLLWHASLMHRGSRPRNTALERRALICHYSGINARPDMPQPERRPDGSYYFPIRT